ncbi:hypothetical protein [Paenibacillus sp.]|uniref:hypothetical protein n=1 Tax=Paenibacillus sp. TaxID=58172 RepID=UPI002D5622B0|nr:hypothetical protein [Paenibacillus sp.]HZG84027.1 hypothetical protein [Paenibacillus sp.]
MVDGYQEDEEIKASDNLPAYKRIRMGAVGGTWIEEMWFFELVFSGNQNLTP